MEDTERKENMDEIENVESLSNNKEDEKVSERNNLVKYDNDFILSSNFNQLTSVQQDIFFSAVSFLCRDKTEHIVIPASVIKTRANLTDKKYKRSAYYKLLHGLEEVILKTVFTVHSDGKEWRGTLFDTFSIDDNTGDFEMYLNPHAAHFFFQIPGPFSQFELQAFMGLTSKYSKNLFRVLIAKYNGRWNPDPEELVNVFGLKNRSAVSTLTHRMQQYIDDIMQTGYFDYIKFKTVRDDARHGRPLKFVKFEFNTNPKKRNELRKLSRWWGEQQLSADEKSYIVQNPDRLESPQSDTNDESKDDEIELKCPICNAKYIKSYNPKRQKDFWGHIDYASSKCCYAKRTFDTIDDLKDFIQFEKEKENQKKYYRELKEKDPIAMAAQKAAAEQKVNREKMRQELLDGNEYGLEGISEDDIVLPEIFQKKS